MGEMSADAGGTEAPVGARSYEGARSEGAGVKKTGVAIGRTFGKIGGVFHD